MASFGSPDGIRQRCKHVYARAPQAAETTFNLNANLTSSMEAPLIAASERFWAVPYRGGGGPVFVRSHATVGKVRPPRARARRAPSGPRADTTRAA